jgi:hypothetical protein
MANLYTYACEPCGFAGVFREDNSLHCPHCRAWPMREQPMSVDAMLATIAAVHGDDDEAEMMAVEMADKAKRRAVR